MERQARGFSEQRTELRGIAIRQNALDSIVWLKGMLGWTQ